MPLTIEYVAPDTLVPAGYNPRRIAPAALERLARLMDEHGFVNPVIARRADRVILGGHQRIKANALRATPDPLVPVVFIDGIDDDRAKALNIALNNPSAAGEFDGARLDGLMRDLAGADMDLPGLTGFAEAEVAAMLATLELPEAVVASPVGHADLAGEVLVIFELTGPQYETVKLRLDELIAEFGLTCHVRAGG